MDSNQASHRIEALQNLISYHREKYYLSEPEISDAAFDALFLELKALESQFPNLIQNTSATQTVSLTLNTPLKKKKHKVPMISLDNAYTKNDLYEWETRWKKFESSHQRYIVEPKFDGLGISCVFSEGNFVYALTRGDGSEGEDVTENTKTFLPAFTLANIPGISELRGEVVMKKSDFNALNTALEKEEKKLFSNPRNAAAGSLRQLDASITKSRNLSVFFYEMPLPDQQNQFKSYQKVLEYFETQQVPHPPLYFICQSIEEVWEKIEYVQSIRESLDYDIDGMVIKINDFSARETIGSTNHHPRWAIAYKFPAKQGATKIESVEWQVGRTGVLTPVANLAPIVLDGVTIARATLHNAEYIAEKDIRINDMVLLERSGDVIPKIISPIFSARNALVSPIVIPTHCPQCQSPVIKIKDEVATKCSNTSCPAVLKGKLEHFASKKCMNIEGLGTRVAEQMIETGIVKKLEDIFLLSQKDLAMLPGFQKKSIENLHTAIEKSKSHPLWRWIHAISIPLVGEKTAKILANSYPQEASLFEASEEDLCEISEIGEKMASEIVQFFKNPENRSVFSFRISDKNEEQLASPQIFAGMTLVFTGTLNSLSREEAQKIAEDYGAQIGSSVSKNTSALIYGDNAGSKYEKAKSLEIPCWDEEYFCSKISKSTISSEEKSNHNPLLSLF